VPRMPLVDQQRKAAIRQSLVWSALSYIPVVAGIAWVVFAWHQWSGRGQLLAVSGLLICLAASSALFLPVLRRLVPPTRGMLGMSVSTYTYLSISAAAAMAAFLAVVAFVTPFK
jgi:hypothetical protein